MLIGITEIRLKGVGDHLERQKRDQGYVNETPLEVCHMHSICMSVTIIKSKNSNYAQLLNKISFQGNDLTT